jgi:hypothetical protein
VAAHHTNRSRAGGASNGTQRASGNGTQRASGNRIHGASIIVNGANVLDTAPVHTVAERVVCLVNEVVAGARPGRQVAPLFTMHLRGAIRRARPERGGVARLRHLIIASNDDGVYEVVAVCSRANRISALGLQLTRDIDGRWQVTDVAHPHLGRLADAQLATTHKMQDRTWTVLSDSPSGGPFH